MMRIIRCVDGNRISVECLGDEPGGACVELVVTGHHGAALSPSDARALARALVEQAELADAERAAAPPKLG